MIEHQPQRKWGNRSSTLIALLAFSVVSSVDRRVEADEPRAQQTGSDRYGYPLPAGAVARFGTAGFRMSGRLTGFAFSPDREVIVAGDANSIEFWDSASGRTLKRIPLKARCLDWSLVSNSNLE
ncbi:MAG: hypothetical protein CMJ78_12065 [Planctomycetaceae bacterium]|nr:hypothetical protein [Planctomycetaceae bacterium]